MDVEPAFVTAREAALLASAELVAALGRKAIFPKLPAGEPLPYVWLGPVQFLDDSDGCGEAFDIACETHVWAKPAKLEAVTAAAIAGIVRRVLKADLAIAGWRIVERETDGVDTFTDPDGSDHLIVRHAFSVEAIA